MTRLTVRRRSRRTASVLLAVALLSALLVRTPEKLVARAAAPPAPAATTAEDVPAGVLEAIAQITSQPRYRRSTWGFSIADLATGERLYEQNADNMFVPARS